MIKLLKSKEVRNPLLLQLLIGIIATGYCYGLNHSTAAVTAAVCLALIIIQYVSTYIRYRRIAALAEDVNKVLHGDNSITFTAYDEGELYILQSEIYKMTVRLREQQQNLFRDKRYLADSLADISHQIRTPLTSINLLVQLLSAPNITDARRQQLSRELYELLSRIDWLITTLLKISRLDAGTVQFKQERVDMKTLLDRACAALLVPMELRGQELCITADGEFSGDIAWTCEAVGNIVKNCMEHTPPGGQIEIFASENTLYSQIVIKDTGKGIAKEDISHIFERFYKGKDSDEKSFGIGLSLARMIITGQNGTVKAENRHSGGAKFTIRFYKSTV